MYLVRLLLTGLLIITYCSLSLIGLLLKEKVRRIFQRQLTSFFCRILLSALRIKIVVNKPPALHKNASFLVVANHLSYLDIVAISSVLPSLFISSMEVRSSPLLGSLARFGGTLFVERRKKAQLQREIGMIAEVMKEGVPVVLFPEGTSTDGEKVLPFKKSLMEAAFLSRRDVLPLCLAYSDQNGRLSGSGKDSVYWYGAMTFLPHFIDLLKQRNITITVQVLEPLKIEKFTSRKEIAAAAYQAITTAYHRKEPCDCNDTGLSRFYRSRGEFPAVNFPV